MDRPQDVSTSTAAQSSLLSRRRKTTPSRPPSSNSPTADISSPEVISSLISSLSTISVPLQTHFEDVPYFDSDAVPPSPLQTEFPTTFPTTPLHPPPNEYGFGMSYGAQKIPGEPPHSPFLHPDDAAVAPVIRMARAPPSPKLKNTFDPSPSPTRPSSRGSYTSSKAAYEDSAFGMITAEPGPRVSTAPSIASSSSGGRKSIKNQFSLLKKSSREFTGTGDSEKQADRLRKTNSYNDSLRYNIPRSRASLRSMQSMADVAEEDRLAMEPHQENVVSTPPSKERHSLQSIRDSPSSTPGGIGSNKVIPARESSLRHSFSSSSRRHRSARHSRYSSTGSKEMKVDSGVFGTGNEAEQVTKRIQELKDQQQKIKTELETDNTPARSTREAPAKQSRPSRAPSEITVDTMFQEDVNHRGPSIDESAPSPAVMTGKSRTGIRTPSSPFASKPTSPQQPLSARQSLDRADQIERLRSRRSLEPTSPARQHKRTPSFPVSTGRASVVDDRPSSADSIEIAVIDYVSSPKLTQCVSHPTTGRIIAFSEVGDPKGHVVLCCLGMGLTRYLMAFYDELARTLNLRLITLDRPGVGESGPYVDESGTPLNWPDDVAIVCNHLKVTKFSILAHSAGAIYALATALRIPQHIRGRIHLLAPWIPPSQLSNISSQKEPVPTNAVPYSQRILRALPTSILKVANSSFMTATSASLTSSLPKSPRRSKRRATTKDIFTEPEASEQVQSKLYQQGDDLKALENLKTPFTSDEPATNVGVEKNRASVAASQDPERQTDYDNRLTHRIWELATTNANPAVDLLVCLERRQPIGFRYVDITRAVVIHHGSRDTRVPVDNIRWLGKTMRRCEVRILEGEGHGLMASAAVMGNVLMEIAKEWEDWMILVQGKRKATVGARSGIVA
ncbi:hypothetical protein ASPWEDRAFT_24523 [Aspergillus wentii DTO 134E9]|uniref:AB hydrolase-1 domain-containing protein n=1 Tax=Aspergillus wentii DTO 134E9 TaxID=1073089 RepID=A0A1L9RUN1_ASPWE|nr:uncharacterized protein ASPWEDRAFT_24523 [Aspergillus wentii DTO 134E9]KAI9928532.1 hypothetical protein MW887_001746 [Aspergillus wentii]OJJ38603.1 hypothetical protein ASPWEDRAFT_24523 [Aspergillus wentii DTO 134E9]